MADLGALFGITEITSRSLREAEGPPRRNPTKGRKEMTGTEARETAAARRLDADDVAAAVVSVDEKRRQDEISRLGLARGDSVGVYRAEGQLIFNGMGTEWCRECPTEEHYGKRKGRVLNVGDLIKIHEGDRIPPAELFRKVLPSEAADNPTVDEVNEVAALIARVRSAGELVAEGDRRIGAHEREGARLRELAAELRVQRKQWDAQRLASERKLAELLEARDPKWRERVQQLAERQLQGEQGREAR